MIIWVLPLQVEWFAEHMRAEDHSVSVIHGDQPPEERKFMSYAGHKFICFLSYYSTSNCVQVSAV